MRVSIEIPNEKLASKIIKILEVFKDEGVRIISKQNELDNWREIGMNTHSANRDDDEYLYEAAWEFYNEKYSN